MITIQRKKFVIVIQTTYITFLNLANTVAVTLVSGFYLLSDWICILNCILNCKNDKMGWYTSVTLT